MLNKQREQKLIDLCRAAIRLPSFSGQEGQVAQLLRDTMEALGYDLVEIDAYGSVLGCLRGSRPGKTVLMDGHIDTVEVPDPGLWTHDPFGAEIQDGRIYGRGASDMKGSVAAMLCAGAWYAQDTGRDFAGEIWLSCTVHEECFEGVSARQVSRRVRPDFVIIGEATTTTLKRGQRGRAEVVVETIGTSCHSSNPAEGRNAVYDMCAVIEELQALVPRRQEVLGEGIYELTDIVSSPYPGASVVPGRCRATYDHRLLVGETEQSVLADVQAAVDRAARRRPGLQAKVCLAEGEETCWTGQTIRAKRFFPAWLLREDDELVVKALAGLRDAGIDAPLSHFAFCTNGSHFCGEAGIPTVGFGPSLEELAHTVDEYIEIDQLTRACEGFQGILRALTR